MLEPPTLGGCHRFARPTASASNFPGGSITYSRRTCRAGQPTEGQRRRPHPFVSSHHTHQATAESGSSITPPGLPFPLTSQYTALSSTAIASTLTCPVASKVAVPPDWAVA